MVDCKTNEYYTGMVTRYYQWGEWISNTFLVITTSSGVAAWAIWSDLHLLWAFVIGISQLLVLLKPFLLFPKYIKVYSDKHVTYQYLSWELEKLWYNYENKIIDDTAAFDAYDSLRTKLMDNDKFPQEVIIITHKKALSKAEAKFEDFKNQL